MSRCGFISFYISTEEMDEIVQSQEEFAVAKLAHLLNKTESALDEFHKQIWPLVMFIAGAALGCFMASNYQFWCLVIPEAIVIFCMTEIILHLLDKAKEPVTVVTASDSEIKILPDNPVMKNQQSYKSSGKTILDSAAESMIYRSSTTETEFKTQLDFGLDADDHQDGSKIRKFLSRSSTYFSNPEDRIIEQKAEMFRRSLSSHQSSNNFVEDYEI